MLDLIKYLLSLLFGNKAQAPSAPTPSAAPTKTPPKVDPNTYREYLKKEVVKKGQPPHGYESVADDPKTAANERKTFCNFFTRAVCRDMFGWNNFESPDRDQAGEIKDYMESHPNQWQKLEGIITRTIKGVTTTATGPDFEAATRWASQGHLVVAAWKNPDYPKTVPTGHVAIIAPEATMQESQKWGRPVPLAANAGGSTNWYGKSLSQGFKEEPDVYLFLGA